MAGTSSTPSASTASNTTIRRLHQELRQARAARQLAEQRFRSVFNQQFQFMAILSPEGRVLDLSEQLPMRGNVPPAQVVGRLFWDTVWWENLPEIRASWPGRLQQAALANGPVLSEDSFNSATGELRVASAAITAVRNAAGEVDCFVIQGTDITERRRSEERRQRLEAQLRETHKMQAIGTLAGGIAHDFNNILGAILGNLELAQQDIGAQHAAQPRLAQIRKAGGRARSLVQQILAFSRRQPNERVAQPLQPVLDETISLLRTTLPASVSLVVSASRSPLWVQTDSTQFQQVLMNLCTNAWHALHGAAGRIEVRLERGTMPLPVGPGAAGEAPRVDCAHLWVRDDGVGMDAATQARIFEPFFTTKPMSEGTGLGLSVVHGIVAEHGGSITVESEPGRGSTFHVMLPLAAGAAADAPPDAPAFRSSGFGGVASPVDANDGGAGVQREGEGRHVLYVDDDDMMVLMVQSLLQHRSYRVTACPDLPSAVAALRREPQAFDVVVTDFNMPGGSGIELALEARAIRADLPVIITSGYLSDSLRAAATEAGVQHLLRKENTVDELCAVLRSTLAGEA